MVWRSSDAVQDDGVFGVKQIAGGCDLDRDTLGSVSESGFEVYGVQRGV